MRAADHHAAAERERSLSADASDEDPVASLFGETPAREDSVSGQCGLAAATLRRYPQSQHTEKRVKESVQLELWRRAGRRTLYGSASSSV
jgi:hypothetical protein